MHAMRKKKIFIKEEQQSHACTKYPVKDIVITKIIQILFRSFKGMYSHIHNYSPKSFLFYMDETVR